MDAISRICATSKGSTIDAIGHGRYRVCNRNAICSEVEGLWQAYETLRQQEQRLARSPKASSCEAIPKDLHGSRSNLPPPRT